MPVYSTPRHGVSYSRAMLEAAAIAPVTRTMLTTFELWHPLGTPDGPIYVVNNFEPFSGTKEAAADRDAGLEVEYLACSIVDARSAESDDTPVPEISLTVGNVSGVMSDALRRARGSLVPWQLIERVYAEDEPSGPAILPPMSLLLSGVDVDGEQVTFRASFGDPVNVAVPRLNFRRAEYPGLVR